MRVPGRALDVEASYSDVVITEIRKKVKARREIVGTTGYRGDENILNVYGDIADGGCNGEVLSSGVGGEK